MKKYMIPLVTAVAVVSVILAGCLPKATPPVEEKEPVRIGAILIRTGPNKSEGDMMLEGVRLAIKDIEEEGGILGGRPIELEVYDEGYSAEVTISAVKEAVSDNCTGLVAFTNTTTGEAGVAALEKYNLPVIVPATGSHRISRDGYYGVAHLLYYAGLHAAALTTWAEDKGVKSGIHVGFDGGYPRDVDAALQEIWGKPDSPVELLPTIWIPIGTEDVSLEVTKAAGKHPDIMFLDVWGRPVTLGALTRLYELGYEGEVAYTMTSLMPSEVAEIPEAAEGAVCTYGWMYNPDIPETVEFADRFIAEYGHDAEPLAVSSYESAKLLLLAMDKAGTDTDTEKIADAMFDLHFMTPRGDPMKLVKRASGGAEVRWSYLFIGQAQAGKLVPIGVVPLTDEDYAEEVLPE